MKISSQKRGFDSIAADAAVVLLPQSKSDIHQFLEVHRELLPSEPGLDRLMSDFRGKEGDLLALYTTAKRGPARIVLSGIGQTEKVTLESIRRSAAAGATHARSLRSHTLVLAPVNRHSLPQLRTSSAASVAHAVVEGAGLALYRFDKYLTKKGEASEQIRELIYAVGEEDDLIGIKRARILIAAVGLARDLENAPANELTPTTLASRARAEGSRAGFSVKVLNAAAIAKLGMGGIVGVSRGSSTPPRFIILDHHRRAAKGGTVVLVGKGVTFDSGGISIKPSANMSEMKMDMSGAAAVLGAVTAAAELDLPVHVVGLIPAVENMPSGSATKPGDVLRHFNGMTSEVDNTDAEGRLILADALGYATRYAPAAVIDLATLTGACVVALGHEVSGMMGNDQSLMDELKESGERTYERVWQLPLYDEYEKLIKSDIADVKNTGGRWAGAITAGWFLKKFIGNYAWVHLDIAGTAILEEATPYIPRGGSGVGVRLLTDFLSSRKSPR